MKIKITCLAIGLLMLSKAGFTQKITLKEGIPVPKEIKKHGYVYSTVVDENYFYSVNSPKNKVYVDKFSIKDLSYISSTEFELEEKIDIKKYKIQFNTNTSYVHEYLEEDKEFYSLSYLSMGFDGKVYHAEPIIFYKQRKDNSVRGYYNYDKFLSPDKKKLLVATANYIDGGSTLQTVITVFDAETLVKKWEQKIAENHTTYLDENPKTMYNFKLGNYQIDNNEIVSFIAEHYDNGGNISHSLVTVKKGGTVKDFPINLSGNNMIMKLESNVNRDLLLKLSTNTESAFLAGLYIGTGNLGVFSIKVNLVTSKVTVNESDFTDEIMGALYQKKNDLKYKGYQIKSLKFINGNLFVVWNAQKKTIVKTPGQVPYVLNENTDLGITKIESATGKIAWTKVISKTEEDESDPEVVVTNKKIYYIQKLKRSKGKPEGRVSTAINENGELSERYELEGKLSDGYFYFHDPEINNLLFDNDGDKVNKVIFD
jgi:hypothetical protein